MTGPGKTMAEGNGVQCFRPSRRAPANANPLCQANVVGCVSMGRVSNIQCGAYQPPFIRKRQWRTAQRSRVKVTGRKGTHMLLPGCHPRAWLVVCTRSWTWIHGPGFFPFPIALIAPAGQARESSVICQLLAMPSRSGVGSAFALCLPPSLGKLAQDRPV